MSQGQLVQATCPGCKGILHIPHNWLNKAVRCKSCGTIVQARVRPTTPPVHPSTPTPAPNSRPASEDIAPGRPTQGTPLPPSRLTTPPKAPPPQPVRPQTDSGFDFEEPSPQESGSKPRKRRNNKSSTGLVVALAFVGGLVMLFGVTAFLFKDRLHAGLKTAFTGQPIDPDDPNDPTQGKTPRPIRPGAVFPRRALIVSVHNYLYANRIVDVSTAPGDGAATPNLSALIRALGNGLKISNSQIVHLSDVAAQPVPPLRSVIEEGITSFLNTSRKQDRIMVFFIGHTREINDKAYLVPLEGEFDDPSTLIPLDWLYDKLAKCPARQKILVLDGNRHNATQGEERPSSGPLSAKFEARLKSPPPGVQVWAACSASQQSEELGRSSLGVFLDSLRLALAPEKGPSALDGRIQQPDELIPVPTLANRLTLTLNEQLARYKIKQTPILAGSPADTGADYDPDEKPAELPPLPTVKSGNLRLVKEILNEISLPSLKGGERNNIDVSLSQLPPFPEDSLKPYESDELPGDSKVRMAIRQARATLWAISTSTVPADIRPEVLAIRKKLGVDLSIMRDQYNYPGEGPAELRFRDRVFDDSKAISRVVLKLERTLEDLTSDELKEEVDKAPKRWQASYTLVLARFKAQLAYLEEYNGLLGQMRKPGIYPDGFDAKLHNAFKMASREKPGDPAGKKYDKEARKDFKKLIDKNPQTPWSVLAKRELLTALGLDWQPF